jgi:hypothetical protein
MTVCGRFFCRGIMCCCVVKNIYIYEVYDMFKYMYNIYIICVCVLID